MRRVVRILLYLVLFPAFLSIAGGWMGAAGFLHPEKRALTADMVRDALLTFKQIGAMPEDFDVRAADGTLLRGWKVRPAQPNGAWVVVLHGVADNRYGMEEHARLLLKAGYGVLMLDSRAHGASGGEIATYGWLERKDISVAIDGLEAVEHPVHLFALGNSMGAGIALQAAGDDPRIEAVVAEAPFADLQEAAYDYAGLQRWPLLGKTLFAPGAWTLILRGQHLAGFPGSEVSPQRSVGKRAFPLLLICDGLDVVLPCRHAEKILRAARGPAELYRVPGAMHTGALGQAPDEFRRRVVTFFSALPLKADATAYPTTKVTTGPAPPDRPAGRKLD